MSVRPRRNANHTFLLLHVTPLTLIWRLPSLKGEKGRKNLVCRLNGSSRLLLLSPADIGFYQLEVYQSWLKVWIQYERLGGGVCNIGQNIPSHSVSAPPL